MNAHPQSATVLMRGARLALTVWKSLEWSEGRVGVVAIDGVQRIIRVDLVDGVKGIVRVVPIDRIRGIPRIDAVDGVEWVLGIHRIDRVEGIVRTQLIDWVEDVVVPLVFLVEAGFCQRGSSGEEETEKAHHPWRTSHRGLMALSRV